MKLEEIKVKTKRIPTRWFWAEHRIPNDLRLISEGKSCGFPYVGMFIHRRVANYSDLMNYYAKKGVKL